MPKGVFGAVFGGAISQGSTTALRHPKPKVRMNDQGNVTVTIWPLAVSAARLDTLRALLSPAEQVRAGRIQRETVAREFIASRGVVRELLALECGCAPGDIAFGTAAHGKPYFERPSPPFAFNISHSGGYCALAIGAVARVGVDIEAVRATVGDLASSVLAPNEAAQYAALPPAERMRAFFRCWVAKEAYLKATGEGLAGGLKSLELAMTADAAVRPVAIRGDAAALAAWRFTGFEVGEAIVGAVAIESSDPVEVCIRYIDAEQTLHRTS